MRRDPFEMLLRCHRRLEEELQALAMEPAPDVASRVLEFIDRAVMRHERDEEESLFPRLPPSLKAIADTLAKEHQQQAQLIQQLREAHDEIGIQVAALALQAAYAKHITLEEKQLFGAAREALLEGELDAIADEMQARRGR